MIMICLRVTLCTKRPRPPPPGPYSVGRWMYPMSPDVNCLPRGVAPTYTHSWPQKYAEANVKVDPTAVVGAGTVLGEGCVVGPGAVVKHSVIGRGAVVEAGCHVEGSYIMAGVRLGRDAKLNAALVRGRLSTHTNRESRAF